MAEHGRLIDADALMKKLGIGKDCSVCEQDGTPYCCWNPNVVDVCEAICDAPTIEERKTGKWIISNTNSKVTTYKCSECGRIVHDDTGYDVSKDYPYCHCGADLRGELK